MLDDPLSETVHKTVVIGAQHHEILRGVIVCTGNLLDMMNFNDSSLGLGPPIRGKVLMCLTALGHTSSAHELKNETSKPSWTQNPLVSNEALTPVLLLVAEGDQAVEVGLVYLSGCDCLLGNARLRGSLESGTQPMKRPQARRTSLK